MFERSVKVAFVQPPLGFVKPVFGESCIIYRELELYLLKQEPLPLDADGHCARPELFALRVNDQPQANIEFASEKINIIE